MVRVRFCTSCIKRMKKFDRLGKYKAYKPLQKKLEKASVIEKKPEIKEKTSKKKQKIEEKVVEKPKKEKKGKKALQIEDIVGKKS